jgi:small GTP-binding protein
MQETTVGVDYRVKLVELPDCKIKFQLWDTGGQEKFRSITRTYYRNIDIVLLVFDLSKVSDFYSKLESWIKEIRTLNDEARIYLIGNKLDLDRKISFELAKDFSEKHEFKYYECSAKTLSNIEEIFQAISNDLYFNKLLKKKEDYYSNKINLVNDDIESNSCFKCF